MEKPAPPGQFPSKGVMPRTGTIGNSAHEGASWQSIGLTGAFYVGLLDGLLDGLLGVAGIIINSDEMDHSRKFSTRHQ